MKGILASFFLLAGCVSAARADVITLQFYKDDCQKFLQSTSDDQQMYLMWAEGRIKRELNTDPKTAGTTIEDSKVSDWLRDYCANHPTATFVDATEAAKAQIGAQSNR